MGTDTSHTFLFADLAGYTALTEVHGDEAAADIALDFCAELNRVLPEGAEDIKMLGDACLVRADHAARAVELGVALVEGVGARHGFPDVRVGLHTGGAVRRGDDWFGSAVNIAARVVALAGPGDVLLTQAAREAAGGLPDVEFDDRGVHELRHLPRPLRVFGVRRSAERESDRWAVDPVCRMRVDPAHRAATLRQAGVEYSFCSAGCAEEFMTAPARYGAAPAARP